MVKHLKRILFIFLLILPFYTPFLVQGNAQTSPEWVKLTVGFQNSDRGAKFDEILDTSIIIEF